LRSENAAAKVRGRIRKGGERMEPRASSPACAAAAGPPKVQIGWTLSGHWPEPRKAAARSAADRVREALARQFPDFDWRVEVAEIARAEVGAPVEPVKLLDDVEVLRDEHGWDFAFAVTAAPLVAHLGPSASAAASSVFAAAVVSLDALASRDGGDRSLETQLAALSMDLFARLNGARDEDAEAPVDPEAADRWLADGFAYGEDELALLHRRLVAVADPRVEEMGDAPGGAAAFYLRSLWRNRDMLPDAILRMRPWAFPVRLSRLTTAAASTMAVLMMTAETWEVAAQLPVAAPVRLSLVALVGTSAYLLRAQRLLARSGRRRLREQRVVTNVGTVVAVGLGMTITYLGALAIAAGAGAALFGGELISDWTGREASLLGPTRLSMAALTASLAVIIGALGASFEPHGYFRHVTHIDEEL
jgi:hypothetical protein